MAKPTQAGQTRSSITEYNKSTYRTTEPYKRQSASSYPSNPKASFLRGAKAEEICEEAAPAIVTFPSCGDLGTLVAGNIIVTTADCLSFPFQGCVEQPELILEDILTAEGIELKVSPLSIDLIRNIATLGRPDSRVFPKEARKFDEFCHDTKAIIADTLFTNRTNPVLICSHHGVWHKGAAVRPDGDRSGMIYILETEQKTLSEVTGGAILSDQGKLIGVVTNTDMIGFHTDLGGAIPFWVYCKHLRGTSTIESEPEASVGNWIDVGGKCYVVSKCYEKGSVFTGCQVLLAPDSIETWDVEWDGFRWVFSDCSKETIKNRRVQGEMSKMLDYIW